LEEGRAEREGKRREEIEKRAEGRYQRSEVGGQSATMTADKKSEGSPPH